MTTTNETIEISGRTILYKVNGELARKGDMPCIVNCGHDVKTWQWMTRSHPFEPQYIARNIETSRDKDGKYIARDRYDMRLQNGICVNNMTTDDMDQKYADSFRKMQQAESDYMLLWDKIVANLHFPVINPELGDLPDYDSSEE
jgi:hypothetical protein